jgi:hypothetical protein
MKAGAKVIEESDLSFSLYMPAGLRGLGVPSEPPLVSLEVREPRAGIYVQTSEVHSDWSSASV